MNLAQKRANKEVLELLNHFHLSDKIPVTILKNMQENQDNNWSFTYDENCDLEDQKIQRETAVLFSTLYIMYICEDEKEKEELKQIYKENEQKFNQNNDFESFIKSIQNKEDEVAEVNEQMTNLPMAKEEKHSLFEKIKKWLIGFIKK
ncbi:MAG: hypothetical protein IJ220_03325 [Clostridia bacterium]|nr:hypothetical protein [Clostridia bacterium]